MTRDQLFAAFFFIAFAFLLWQFYRVFSAFLAPIAWAAILALVFYPTYRGVVAKVPNPTVASLAMTVLIVLIVVLPSLILSGIVVGQARNFYEYVQQNVQSGDVTAWIESLRETRIARFVVSALPEGVREETQAPDLALRAAQAATNFLVSSLGGVARNLLNFVMDFLIMTFTLFFFFRDGDRLYYGLRRILPMEREHKDAIFAPLYEMLSAVVQGMTATAVAQGLLCGIAFWVLGLPFPLLLAFAAGLASFIPFFGAGLVWVPAVVYFLILGSVVKAVLLAVWGTFVVGLVDNVIRPIIIGDRTKIPTLFLFFGILGGLQAYGVIGVFLGPALLAILVAFLRIYREEYATVR